MGRAEQKQETRLRILEAAARQLRADGLPHSGVQRIMEEAGLTHGGFYSHFASKEQLVADAIGNALDSSSEALLGGSRGDPGPERRRGLLSRYLSRGHRDAPGAGCPLPSTSADVARSPAAVRQAYEEGLRRIIEYFEAELRDLPEEQMHLRARGTLALCVGGMLLARAVDDPTLSDDILESCRQFAAEIEEKP